MTEYRRYVTALPIPYAKTLESIVSMFLTVIQLLPCAIQVNHLARYCNRGNSSTNINFPGVDSKVQICPIRVLHSLMNQQKPPMNLGHWELTKALKGNKCICRQPITECDVSYMVPSRGYYIYLYRH